MDPPRDGPPCPGDRSQMNNYRSQHARGAGPTVGSVDVRDFTPFAEANTADTLTLGLGSSN